MITEEEYERAVATLALYRERLQEAKDFILKYGQLVAQAEKAAKDFETYHIKLSQFKIGDTVYVDREFNNYSIGTIERIQEDGMLHVKSTNSSKVTICVSVLCIYKERQISFVHRIL